MSRVTTGTDSACSANERPIVIDTNIWLDLLVFCKEPRPRPAAVKFQKNFEQYVCHQGIPIATCRPALDELADVLTRDQFKLDATQIAQAMQTANTMTRIYELANDTPCELQCQDPDDQKFLDLAVVCQASALLSRDKALIRLSKAARQHYELFIGDFDAWVKSQDCSDDA